MTIEERIKQLAEERAGILARKALLEEELVTLDDQEKIHRGKIEGLQEVLQAQRQAAAAAAATEAEEAA